MASHYRWYPSESEVVVPFNARYSFPSQANKTVKMTPRIPPKTGSTFTPGSIVRLEFPAQGYVNPANTTLEFDVLMYDWGGTTGGAITRFQNNIQSLFSRVRLLYGSTPIEDIINYNVIVRSLTEWTGTTQIGTLDQTSICDGIGGVVYGAQGRNVTGDSAEDILKMGLVNIRQAYIQGIDGTTNNTITIGTNAGPPVTVSSEQIVEGIQLGNGFGVVPNSPSLYSNAPVQRYQVSLALGLFSQEKLIPTKFMASQLAIEITLEQPAACMISFKANTTSGAAPTYAITNVNLIPEILEFDASYGNDI